MPPLPAWTWRNIIALVSLFATIIGAAVLTLFAYVVLDGFNSHADRLISELVRDPKVRPEVGQVLLIVYEAMAWGLKLLLGGVLLVLLSLGIAITPRRIKFGKDGAEMSGGDDAPAATVTTTTEVKTD